MHPTHAPTATGTPTLTELIVADEPDTWAKLGFAVEGDRCIVDGVTIRLAGRRAGRGLVAWRLDGGATDIDGLPAAAATDGSPDPGGGGLGTSAVNPNGVSRLDHVVALTGDLDRTRTALAEVGLRPRRTVEGNSGGRSLTYAFFLLGPAILELIGPTPQPATPDGRAPDTPAPWLPDAAAAARFWGVAFVSDDLDALAVRLGDHLGPVRDAVQPGRRIATLRRGAGLSVPVAFMTPRMQT